MKIINSMGLETDRKYEPPYSIMWGVNDETTGTRVMTMQRTIIPPRGKNKLHYHACDATFYVAKGPVKVYFGDPENPECRLVEEGHFCYAPGGRGSRPGEPERDRARRAHRQLRRLLPPGQGGHRLC